MESWEQHSGTSVTLPSSFSTSTTYHVVDIFKDGCEAANDQGELVLGDVDQTFLVVLCADFGVSILVSHFNREL